MDKQKGQVDENKELRHLLKTQNNWNLLLDKYKWIAQKNFSSIDKPITKN